MTPWLFWIEFLVLDHCTQKCVRAADLKSVCCIRCVTEKLSGQSKRIAPFETSNYSELFRNFLMYTELNLGHNLWLRRNYFIQLYMKQFWWSLKLRLLWEIETSVSQNTPSWTHVSKIKVLNCQQNCCACAVKNNYVKWWSKVQKINSAAILN